MDSKHSAAPLGGEKTGKNPTDRGKSGAKINLLVDGCGAPISVVLTGANRHDTRFQPWNSWSRWFSSVRRTKNSTCALTKPMIQMI